MQGNGTKYMFDGTTFTGNFVNGMMEGEIEIKHPLNAPKDVAGTTETWHYVKGER